MINDRNDRVITRTPQDRADSTYGWRSLTFFCALLGLPSSSELFTLDLVLAIFFSFCLESPEMTHDHFNVPQSLTFGHPLGQNIKKLLSQDKAHTHTYLSSPYWRWSHSPCSRSAFPSSRLQTEPSPCRDA